jgi:xylan 1,4-beta-xylosidase
VWPSAFILDFVAGATQAGPKNVISCCCAFVGMACQDTAGTARPADFDYFEYKERSYRENPFADPMS